MAAATAQGTYISPMAALAAGQLPHALNGMPNTVVPPTSGKYKFPFIIIYKYIYIYIVFFTVYVV